MTTNNDSRRSRRLIIGLTMAMIAATPVHADILFRPVGRPPEVFAYNGTTMSKPLTNTKALRSCEIT